MAMCMVLMVWGLVCWALFGGPGECDKLRAKLVLVTIDAFGSRHDALALQIDTHDMLESVRDMLHVRDHALDMIELHSERTEGAR